MKKWNVLVFESHNNIAFHLRVRICDANTRLLIGGKNAVLCCDIHTHVSLLPLMGFFTKNMCLNVVEVCWNSVMKASIHVRNVISGCPSVMHHAAVFACIMHEKGVIIYPQIIIFPIVWLGCAMHNIEHWYTSIQPQHTPWGTGIASAPSVAWTTGC